jgi:ATP-dependent exoDNAse (exonuclease V) beta subunit
MTMVADDSDDRRRALDPRLSCIVQAPAGAGKTELLTQRFLVLLANAGAPEEILAITFTRKAASEMHNRIMGALDLAANESEPEAAHRRLTWQLARAVLDADRRHGWELRLNPSRLRILTIDALCAALTRRMPLMSGFGAPPRVVEDASALYREAARQTIAELESGESWSPAIEHLLRHLDNDVAQIEERVMRMLAQRDQWLPFAAGGLDRAALERSLAAVRGEALRKVRDCLSGALETELIEPLRYALTNRAEAGAEVDAALAALAAGRLPGTQPGEVEAWCQIARSLLTMKGEWRSKLTVRDGFPAAGKGAGAELRRDMKDRMTALLERLREEEEELRAALAALDCLPPGEYTDAQWSTIEALVELLRLAAGLLEVIFRERGEVDFPRVARAALDALGDPEHPSDLALALDRRIRHILVDEFQDTSIGQFQLLRGLTAGWEPGDGRTLFLVGDPMQSIYRFREAEVGLYLKARSEGVGDIGLEALQLSVNYRSQAGIIDWINDVFRQVLPAREDVESGAVSYAPSRAHHPPLAGEAVRIHPLIDSDAAGEASLVRDLVVQAQERDPEGSIAVLVRGRGHLAAIVPALKEASIRFRAVEIEHLMHRPVIRDLIALTQALTHPGDRLAWLSVLRAPWCGVTLADMHALVGDAPREAVWDLLNEDARLERLSAAGSARILRLREVLATSLAERGRRRLRERVEGAWMALGGPACVEQPVDLEDAQVLFEVLDDLAEGGDLVDRIRLRERIETLFARPAADGDTRLHIMTIHKAKGLEFDTVIVPGLDRKPRGRDQHLWVWMQRARGDLLLAPIREAGSEDPVYRYIQALDRQKAVHEDGRLLYVAVTRARRRLHLIGNVATRDTEEGRVLRAPNGDSLLARLWPAVEAHFTAAMHERDADAGTEAPAVAAPAAERTLCRLPLDWRLPTPLQPVAARPVVLAQRGSAIEVEFVWASETARHVGTITHRLLQECARAGLVDMRSLDEARLHAAAMRALAVAGVPAVSMERAAQRVVDAIRSTLEDERGRWILDPRHEDARCEYALSGVHEGRLVSAVIDRCFIDAEGVRWIIDYKTGAHEGSGLDDFLDREQARYREQLERYAEMFRRREQRPVRMGLYFPLLRGWREWGGK